jgi:hypothetical protein
MLPDILKNFEKENTIIGKLNDNGGNHSWRSIISYSKKDVVK